MSREREDEEPPAATSSSSAPDWLDDPIAFLASDLDLVGFDHYGWLPASTAPEQHDAGSMLVETPPYQSTLPLSQPGPSPVASCAAPSPVTSPEEIGHPKKRKSPKHTAPPGQGGRQRQVGAELPDKAGSSCGSRKPSKKGSAKGGAGAAGLDRDARWAEQLLNPCAAAIEAGNLPRAQHLLYVLGELASFSSGDANHRLAAHGLRALALLLPAAVGAAAASSVKMPTPPTLECPAPASFAFVEPRIFRAALIRFHEASPWFAVPNALANAAIIAQVAKAAATTTARGAAAAASAELDPPRRRSKIHVVDLGVSHGVQWPTLLDALARVPRGATPPSVRLTVAGPAATPQPAPFSASPPGYDCSPQLLRYARSINLDLTIDHAPCLDTLHGVTAAPGEVRVVCVQFRLSHATADEQAAVLQKVRSLNPELVVLAELDGGGVRSDGSATSEFTARLDLLWSFLESTAAAFKGKDVDERRVMEAEAGTALTTTTARRVHGREAWRARMAAAGFAEAAFGGEAVETAKALLRKYDCGWELAPPSPSVGLRWKGQPVSFCSLWRPV
ncbi:hypothetical protein EJB05_11309, partial [Eragrostis curvula]